MEARLKQDNVNMFDPRSVGRVTWYWSNGQYRVTQPNIDRMEAVEASDYDRLLTLAEDKDSTIATLRADASKAAEELARLEAHFNAGQHCERRDCEKALVALAGANVCTPAETYGSNSSWAISDLCRGVTTLAAELARERERHQWIEIKEGCRLPEYGEIVTLISRTTLGGPYQETCDWNLAGDWREAKDADVAYWKPIDWPALLEPQPAPAPAAQDWKSGEQPRFVMTGGSLWDNQEQCFWKRIESDE